MRRARLFLAAACLMGAGSLTHAQRLAEVPPQPPQLPPDPLEVEPANSPFVIYPIRDGVYMISGPDGNVTVQEGRDGVVVVDTGTAASAPALLTQIRRLSKKPILYILNTNGDPDHVGGNAIVAAAGVTLAGTANTRPSSVPGSTGSPIFAHEDVMNRMTEAGVAQVLPKQTYFVYEKDMFFNGEPVSLLHAPGHTSGDSFVMFRRSDVIAAGDIYTPDRYPQIDLKNGGSIQQVVSSIDYLIRLTVPEFNEEGGTFVVPGHGRLSDEGDIADYRDMVIFIRDRVQAMIDAKMTLTQIKAARPTTDYDGLYGKKAGDDFVDQIYQSLTRAETGQ
jgi:glyoxylase-like metal-dependent hydrolase (beta-lactamase superfamily II)